MSARSTRLLRLVLALTAWAAAPRLVERVPQGVADLAPALREASAHRVAARVPTQQRSSPPPSSPVLAYAPSVALAPPRRIYLTNRSLLL